MSTGLSAFGVGGPLAAGDPFGGFTGYGFNIPQGDPGAIEAAGGAIGRVGTAFEQQGRSLNSAAKVAVDADGGWTGTASGAYSTASSHIVSALSANATACSHGATALQKLSTALSHAQSLTRKALTDCEAAHKEIVTQQGIATRASQAADGATTSAANAVHPSTVTAFQHQATVFRQEAGDAQTRIGDAQTALEHAETRGKHAYETYTHEAQALRGRIQAAAGQLRTIPSVGGRAPIPITSSPGDVSLAAGLASQLAAGKLKGPLINAIPPSERTPGVIAALLADEREAVEQGMQQGGAKGPYGPWTNNQFLNPATVNAMVAKGLMPPKPSNWDSMTPSQQQQYLKALGPYFSGLTCVAGACSFVKATGTGTRSIPQVLHTLSRMTEYTAIGVCAVGSDGACLGAVRVVLVADSASNAANSSSLPSFIAHEGVTASEVVVAGGGGIIASKLGDAGLLDAALPSSTLGKTALKVYFTTPSGVVTVLEPRIDQHLFPDPGPRPHGHG
jgi:hypothetical protein